jgi:hypothetical protein
MPVTGDPLAEIDAALVRTATRLHAARARARADTLTIQRLTAWIDYRLDQRPGFEYHGRRTPAHNQRPASVGGEPSRPRSLRRPG